MTMLQHEITDFKAQAFQNDDFHEVTKADVLGHWSVFFFYPADFTFVCPTELEDLAEVQGNRLRNLLRLLRYAFRAQGVA